MDLVKQTLASSVVKTLTHKKPTCDTQKENRINVIEDVVFVACMLMGGESVQSHSC